jgi:ribosomal protein S18 acetylase RimI-like enzyme
VVVEEVNCSAPGMAEQVFAVRQDAYAQEAHLLGLDDFPPLRKGVEELRASLSRSFVVRQVGEVVGVLELESEPEVLCISALVVSPRVQGRGVGSALLRAAIAAAAENPLEVQTAVLNEPAVRLYKRHGFVLQRTWRLEQGLELARFRYHGRGKPAA